MRSRRLLVLSLSALVAVPLTAAPASATSTSGTAHYAGGMSYATQDTFAHQLTVRGFAYDRTRTRASIRIRIYVDGHPAALVHADRPSPGVDRARGISGAHVYSATFRWTRRAGDVRIVAVGSSRTIARRTAAHHYPAAAARIVAVAKRYVGARYVEGGSSPKGFDCSGYVRYVFAHANVRQLPHNAEAQRHVHGMHRISAHAARAGDLVFYLSGGSAFHVAIYAGHGRQWAATEPRDGVLNQSVWSSAVEYRTLTH